MKKLICSLTIAAATLSAANAFAGASDSQNLTACKAQVNASVQGVEKIRVAGMKSRRGVFTAKLRVIAGGERGLMVCKIDDKAVVALDCKSGSFCKTASIAAN